MADNQLMTADPGECLVNLNTDKLTIEITVRAPLSIVKQTVSLGVYDFISIFGQTIAAAGSALLEHSRRAASQFGRPQ